MKTLLTNIFNHDFSGGGDFTEQFFAHELTLADLRKACSVICGSYADIGGQAIPAAIRIKGNGPGAPFAILAQLHGNEPAGLAGILLAMALSGAERLERDIIGIIGNPLAAAQYFDAWEKSPRLRQEKRDAYRCGLADDETLLPDMNRIPEDFLSRPTGDPHIARAQELYHVGKHVMGIVDIHSARGNLVCVTDHKRAADLKCSPIRNILDGLAEAISANASKAARVQTFKTILAPLPNIESHTGIEAGRHESTEAPRLASSFTLSLLHRLGIASAPPLEKKETGIFTRYCVQPRLTYADLKHNDTLSANDRIYLAKACRKVENIPKNSDRVAVRKSNGFYEMQTILEFFVRPAGELEYGICQYEEMEAIAKNQVVAVAVPSGTAFTAPFAFSGIFVSKSGTLYDKDPSVGPWPVAATAIDKIKFCYPCEVGEMKLPI
ncbi:MAG: hypothetical protein KGI29_09435 [Pseudomonadota bacterium]|nr:hypothetical protein [Pseudomonadota bacterium]MDE3038704.1 hypothetical protein [Pseudomonadota bacterium]